MGDPIEARALSEVFKGARQRPLLIGTVKTNIGHLEAAARIAGLIKTVLCLHYSYLPRNLHFDIPNPEIAFDEWALRW